MIIESQNTCDSPKPISPSPKTAAADGNHADQPAHAFARGQRERGDERAHAHRAHQEAERVRAAVQHLGRKDRHQHHKRHAHQADHGKQQQDGADGQEPET
jgi:hypothetical protein